MLSYMPYISPKNPVSLELLTNYILKIMLFLKEKSLYIIRIFDWNGVLKCVTSQTAFWRVSIVKIP